MKIHLVFGGPGTGKTSRLADIYRQSVKEYGDDSVRFISFTRSQIRRDKLSIKKKTGKKYEKLKGFSTVHSAGMKSFGDVGADIIDRFELHKISDFAGVQMEMVLKGLDYMKSTGTDNYAVGANKAGMTSKQFAKCAYFYEKIKEQKNKTHRTVDFSDMIQNAIDTNFTADCRVCIIDEAQDLTSQQWQMVYVMYKNAEHLYVAGDPNQAIYAFTGGRPNYMNEMRYDTIEFLERSYRCCDAVMMCADAVAKKMKNPVKVPSSNGKDTGFAVFYPHKDLSLFKKMLARYSKGGSVLVLANTYDQLKKCEDLMLYPDGRKYHPNGGLMRPFGYSFVSGKEKRIRLVSDRIIFSTVHQAKGMEADYVIYNISSGRSNNGMLEYKDIAKDYDEFYRLLYVGITRAKKGIIFIEPSVSRIDDVRAVDFIRFCNIGKENFKKFFTPFLPNSTQ